MKFYTHKAQKQLVVHTYSNSADHKSQKNYNFFIRLQNTVHLHYKLEILKNITQIIS